MKKKATFPKSYLLVVVTLISLLIAWALYSIYLNKKDVVRSVKENNLKTIADFKIGQISAWYLDEISDIDFISMSETLSEYTNTYLQTKSVKDLNHLKRYIKQVKTEHLYSEVVLVSLDGKMIASTHPNLLKPDALDLFFLRVAIAQNKTQYSDLFRAAHDGKVYFDEIAVVKDKNNKNLMGLICRVDPQVYLNPLVTTWTSSGKTGESYLVKKDSTGKVYSYRPKQANASTGTCWKLVHPTDQPSTRSVSGYKGIYYGKNEQGVRHCSYVSPIPGTPWSIVIKAETAELFKDLHTNMIELLVIVLLLILDLISGIALYMKGRREKDLRNLLAKETELRQYEERFNVTMDILGEGVCLFRADDQSIVMTNPKMDEIFGYQPGELVGQQVSIFLAPTHKTQEELVHDYIFELEANNDMKAEFYNQKKDGTPFWTITHIYPLTHDTFGPVWIAVVQDITEQKNYQAKLVESEALYKSMFENNPHPMWVYDVESLRFLSVNETAVAKYGYSLDEFLTMKIQDILPQEDLPAFEEKMLGKDGLKTCNLCRNKLKDGRIIHVEIASHEIDYHSRHARLVLANDVTKTTEYELALIHAKEKAEESERLKTAFLANMSHEIRTPLNGILGFSQLLKEENLTHEEIKKYSGYILDGGNRLLELLSNILNMSKIESGAEVLTQKNFYLNEQLRGLYNQFHLRGRDKKIEFKLSIPNSTENLQLMTDVVKFRQILTNYLSNSFKFTHSGSVELGYTCNEREVDIYVKDTGVGVDPNKTDMIFERFFQADDSSSSGHEGAGLGLAICKGFSNLMNGEIRVESIPGSGSTFYLKLPLHV